MTADLAQRLREWTGLAPEEMESVLREAADRIEALEAEELRRAFTENSCGDPNCDKARLTAALLVLRGGKEHKQYADVVLHEYARQNG